MHRSGTSCLTGSLQQAGLELGDISTWNPHNLKGNRESGAIMMLNDAILEDNGGSWHTPPAQVIWSDQHRQRARKIIEQHSDAKIWGFKDPRTLLTLNGWLELLPNASLVGIFRDPRRVAGSLVKRGAAFPDAAPALDLWNTYNRHLLHWRRQRAFPLLDFDWEEARFHKALNTVHQQLGLAQLGENERFFESDLVHEHDASVRLPLAVRWTHYRLRRLSRALG